MLKSSNNSSPIAEKVKYPLEFLFQNSSLSNFENDKLNYIKSTFKNHV